MALTDDVTKKVQRLLADEFGTVKVDRDGDFVVQHESAVLFIRVYPVNDKPDADIVVRAFSPMIVNVPLTTDLYRWVATLGQEFFFGSCRIVEESDGKTGRVEFCYSIVGNDLDPNEIQNLVYRSIFTANSLDNELRAKFGGDLFGPDSDD